MNNAVYTEVLNTFTEQGAEEALKTLMRMTREITSGHITILIQKRVISTIKNEDDREIVRDNYWAWKKGQVKIISDRVPGYKTRYHPLRGDYDGEKVIAAVLITELPGDYISSELLAFYSMLVILCIKSESKQRVDGITSAVCASVMLNCLNNKKDCCCVAMFRFPDIDTVSMEQGWQKGDAYARNCVSLLDEYKPYYLSRHTFALLLDGEINETYEMIYTLYEKIKEPVNILIAECPDPQNWNMLGRMYVEMETIRGISIMTTRKAVMSQDNGEDFNLFEILGIEPGENICQIEQVVKPKEMLSESSEDDFVGFEQKEEDL